jgi:hypothetical protein
MHSDESQCGVGSTALARGGADTVVDTDGTETDRHFAGWGIALRGALPHDDPTARQYNDGHAVNPAAVAAHGVRLGARCGHGLSSP